MKQQDLDEARIELSVKAKNGIDFITSASIIWVLITFIWTLSYSAYHKSVFTLMTSGIMLPLAFTFSKVYKTQWKIQENPLQPLGLILNLAQLFYFPFLILCLIKFPEYFVPAYSIITGAHFFPYAWFYKEPSYGVFAGIIPLFSFLISLVVPEKEIYYVPAFTAFCLAILGILIFIRTRKSKIENKA